MFDHEAPPLFYAEEGPFFVLGSGTVKGIVYRYFEIAAGFAS